MRDANQRSAYRALAESSLYIQSGYGTESTADLSRLEPEFREELDEADRWFQGVVADERNWILEDADVDAAFTKTYYRAPEISFPVEIPFWVWLVVSSILVILGLRWRRQRRRVTPDF